MELIQLYKDRECAGLSWDWKTYPISVGFDSEWKDTQEERHDNRHILKFFIGVCDCGAENLYCIEYSYLMVDDLNEIAEEIIDLNCPGCGSTRHAKIRCNMSTGAKVRILESWSHDIETSGFNNDNLERDILKLRKENAELKEWQSPVKLGVENDDRSYNKILKLELRLSRMRMTDDSTYLKDIANQFREQILYELTRQYLVDKQQKDFDKMYAKSSNTITATGP